MTANAKQRRPRREGSTPRPPGDPALLRPIGGDLYAVEAVWDLTELEQLVLSQRRLPVASW
jgi:hypothetical protein